MSKVCHAWRDQALDHRQLIDMLVRHPPATPLFPRLTDLSVYILCDDVVHDEELTPVSSTHLTKLRVSLTPSKKQARLDIDALYRCCASDVVVTLAVSELATMPNIVGARKDILRGLVVEDFDDEGYAVAAALPALETPHRHAP